MELQDRVRIYRRAQDIHLAVDKRIRDIYSGKAAWSARQSAQQEKLRSAERPLRITEKAAHHFLQAHSDAAIVGALRYGQVLGLGGDAYLAGSVAESKLGRILPDEPFWESVLHFFVNQPRLSLTDV